MNGTHMTKRVILNNVDHQNLRVISKHGESFGESVNIAPIFPTEFTDAQRDFPILFRKDPESGDFQAVVLLGLDKNENLFLDGERWAADYVPAVFSRGPFSIALQQREVDGQLQGEPMVHIDLDDPRVSETEGEPLFLEQGGNSQYLNNISDVLNRLYSGVATSREMFDAFQSCDLLEPVSVEVTVNDEKRYKIENYYTINEEKLVDLEGAKLKKLSSAGFLRCAYMAIASLGRISKLIDIKNKRSVNA
jgi:hypothetical protein